MSIDKIIDHGKQEFRDGNYHEAMTRFTQAQDELYQNEAISQAITLFEHIRKCHEKISDKETKINFFLSAIEKTKHSDLFDEMHLNSRYNLLLGKMHQQTNEEKSKFHFLKAANKFYIIANKYENLNLIVQAVKAYKTAYEIHSVHEGNEQTKELFINYINTSLRFYNDLVISANVQRYTYNPNDSVKIAWQSIKVAITMISDSLAQNYDLKHISKEILKKYDLCKLCLLSQDRPENAVIDLKLNELNTFFDELADDIPDDPEEVSHWLAIHIDSIKFMVPQTSPQFMIISADGRLIHFVEVNENIIERSEPTDHLTANLISVARMMFIQTSFSGSSLIKEIVMSDSTILIDNRENFVVIAIVSVIFDGLKEFIAKITNDIEDKFDKEIQNWLGDHISVSPIIDMFEKELRQKIASKWNN